MTDEEINRIVSELLRKRFADIGFERATVETEEDFDGSDIIRVRAHFNNGEVSADRIIDARHEIRSELIKRGDQRFVFFNTVFPHDQEEVDDDLE